MVVSTVSQGSKTSQVHQAVPPSARQKPPSVGWSPSFSNHACSTGRFASRILSTDSLTFASLPLSFFVQPFPRLAIPLLCPSTFKCFSIALSSTLSLPGPPFPALDLSTFLARPRRNHELHTACECQFCLALASLWLLTMHFLISAPETDPDTLNPIHSCSSNLQHNSLKSTALICHLDRHTQQPNVDHPSTTTKPLYTLQLSTPLYSCPTHP